MRRDLWNEKAFAFFTELLFFLDMYVFSFRKQTFHTLDSIGFWRWCITHRIAGVFDFIHRPDFTSYKKKEE
jgi:hypothetical protein